MCRGNTQHLASTSLAKWFMDQTQLQAEMACQGAQGADEAPSLSRADPKP